MTGHAQNAFGRQSHGDGAQAIPLEMAPLAGLLLQPNHLVNCRNLSRPSFSEPANKLQFSLLGRFYVIKMTRPTGHPGVDIMGNFFVMTQVTSLTISRFLTGVLELGCLGVALYAVDFGMRS